MSTYERQGLQEREEFYERMRREARGGDQWRPISTRPESDDLMWFLNSASLSIEGPRGAQIYDADKFDYWAPCEPPGLP